MSSLLEELNALRDAYLHDRGLTIEDFGLNYRYPVIPSSNWDWFGEHKFSRTALYKRHGFFLIYIDVNGEPYLNNNVPYGLIRLLGIAKGVPEDETPAKVLAQYGRRSELHFEPLRDGRAWDSLGDGTIVYHCESLIKAKLLHKITGAACVGYNGVNGYSSGKQGVELIHKSSGFAFERMHNIILFDSDVATNPKVIAARENLAHKLKHILGATMVSFCDLPRPDSEGAQANWGLDDFVMAKGQDALLRVLETTKPYQDEKYSDLVGAMNERLRVVTHHRMCYDRSTRSLMTNREAEFMYRNVNRVELGARGSIKTVYGFDAWSESIHRLSVDQIGYRYLGDEFYESDGVTYANEFVGAGADPGNESLKDDEIVLQTLRKLFKPDDLELMRSYLKFLKFSDRKPTSYCVLWSNARGVGKGWFTELARGLIGRPHVSTSTADMLAKEYNLHTVKCRLLIVHEFSASTGAFKKAALNYLKTYVGDETIAVRAMHRNPYQAEVRAGLIITVNEKSDMPSDGLGDRRQWYIEAGVGGEPWGVDGPEWRAAFEAVKDDATMARVSRWVSEAKDIDFAVWRPPLTEERVEDLMSGLGTLAQIAHEVLLDMRGLGIRVMTGKAVRQLMVDKMEGQEIGLVGKSFGKMLKEAGWWTDKAYAAVGETRTAAWFTQPVALTPAAEVLEWMRADALKIVRKY